MILRALALLILSVGLLQGASAQAPTAPEVLAADSPRTTPRGTMFTAPAGWSVRTGANLVTLDPPEGDSHLAIVDVNATNADEAIAAAWAAYRPDRKWPLKVAVAQAPRDAWEERRVYQYETSPNERMTVFAAAWRAGAIWTAIIVEASDSTYGKRSSQAGLVFTSLRPAGYQRETFAGRKANPLTPERIAIIKAFLADGMQQLGVPGVAFSLVDGGKVVYEGGLGVKTLGKPQPIDADTLFIAASNTKAMTTLLLAELVDAKKLAWDQPVVAIDPTFRLGSADITRQVLVKHLICACTGMPRQDFEWLFEYSEATPTKALAMLGTTQPTSHFGEVFQYSNLMAAAAGHIGAKVISPGKEPGAAYDQAMRERIFAPLSMGNTTFDFKRAIAGNHASPHGDDVDGKPSLARMDLNYSIVPVRPAGGVWTSAHDLTRYVQMELAQGKLAVGRQLVSSENLLARAAPQILVAEDIYYGMGLFVDTRWGVKVVHHGGDLAGYHGDMIWLPEHGVGAVILTNADPGAALRAPFLRKLVEVLFDGKSEAAEQLQAAAAQRKAVQAKERERLVVPADPKETAKLAAIYSNSALGTVTVRKAKGGVVFDVGEWRSTVASRRNDDGTISFITIDPTIAGFEFVVAASGDKRGLIVRDAQHEYRFTEVAGR